MRYFTALSLAVGLGAAASVYTSAALAGVYVGVGIAPPVVVAPVVASYYAPSVYAYGPRYWGGWYGPRYGQRRFWGHPHWGYHRR